MHSLDYGSSEEMQVLGNHKQYVEFKNSMLSGFPGGAVVKNMPTNAGDTGSSPGPGRLHMPPSN